MYIIYMLRFAIHYSPSRIDKNDAEKDKIMNAAQFGLINKSIDQH